MMMMNIDYLYSDDEYPAKGRHGLDCCPDMLCPIVVSRVPIFHRKSFNFLSGFRNPLSPYHHHSSRESVSTLTKPTKKNSKKKVVFF
jgi:hypothetical protein